MSQHTRGSRSGHRSIAASVVVALVVMSACAGSSASQPSGSSDGDPLADASFGLGAEMQPGDPSALEDVGVQVIESIGDLTAIEAPLVLTRVQADRLLADVGPDSGLHGASIDELVPLPAAVPPMSFLLAAWVSTAETSAAATSRAWMGERDWSQAPQIRFPDAVVALFVLDMATAADEAASPDDGSPQFDLSPFLPLGPDDVEPVSGFAGVQRAAPMLRAGPCTAVQNFLSVAIAAVVNALHINPAAGGGADNFLVEVFNAAVDLLAAAAREAIDKFFAPAFNLIRTGIATLAIVTQIASFFTDTSLTVKLVRPRSPTRFAIGDQADITGEFVAHAASLTGKWPGELIECAKATHVTLPTPIGVGADATWTVTQRRPVVIPASTATKVGDDLTARLNFTTGRETEEDAKGQLTNGVAYAAAEIERKDVKQLLQLGRDQVTSAKNILLSWFPLPLGRAAADAALSAVIDPMLDRLQQELDKKAGGIFTLSGSEFVVVDFHVPPDPTTTLSTTTAPTTEPPPDFCTQYRAMLDNALATAGMDIPPWSGEIARRLERMRPAAPAHILIDVDSMIATYQAFASDADADTIIELGLANPGASDRVNSFCGVEPLL